MSASVCTPAVSVSRLGVRPQVAEFRRDRKDHRTHAIQYFAF